MEDEGRYIHTHGKQEGEKKGGREEGREGGRGEGVGGIERRGK